jgi:hypothetical protein
MENHNIATVINFCSNESRFIDACIEKASLFSKNIIVPICDHFFDGSRENIKIINNTIKKHRNCKFIIYPYLEKIRPSRILKRSTPPNLWHCISRLVGYHFLEEFIDYIFFIDADEIFDAELMCDYLKTSDYKNYDVIKLANYWYFRSSSWQAKNYEDSVPLVKKTSITTEMLISDEERSGFYDFMKGKKKRMVVNRDGLPMIHHYSWVRTKKELLKKVTSWGHKFDRDWVSLIEKEFKSDFKGKDFVHGYEYKKIKPLVDINMDDLEENITREKIQGSDRLSVMSTDELFCLLEKSCPKKRFFLF